MKTKERENQGKNPKASLLVKTSHEVQFDSRWSEIKIDGKNISNRSNHIAVFYNSCLYIHGGYDADKGILSDFHCINLEEDS